MRRELKTLRRFLGRKSIKVAVICHQNADPDALCSAYALECLAWAMGCRAEFSTLSDEVSSITANIAEELKIDYSTSNDLESFDKFIVVDAGTPEQLGKFHDAPFMRPTMVIDHHVLNHKDIFSSFIVDHNATATAEIITKLFEVARIRPSEKASTALLIGILYDSRNFYIATPKTLRAAAFLIENGADYTAAQEALKGTMDRAERVARLKAAKRAELIDINGWIIVFTQVGSYEASAGRGLIELGADVAIVGSERKDETRVSGRATKRFYEKTGIHLGEVMKEVEGKVKGSGGGHSLAAGFNGESPLNVVFKEIQEILKKKIKESNVEGLNDQR
ncbi:MAG: DHH family phosphoesterase [Candidatus Jordarchaeales archaeon]|nr:DHH family phosphoesterase [Candidatus Jordarchaeia archaeon]